MNKEEQTLELQILHDEIKKFMVTCCIPWGDYTDWEIEDIKDCIKACAIHFYNKGIEAERRGLQREMEHLREKWDAKNIKDYDIAIDLGDGEDTTILTLIDTLKKESLAQEEIKQNSSDENKYSDKKIITIK